MDKDNNKSEKATFAGGCFWCMEAAFKEVDGVIDVMSGYTGGTVENPTYEQVCSGSTGHYEAIQVTFDPSKITYGELLERFWKSIDPTDKYGQFVDKGNQYLSAIFYHDENQKKLAEDSKVKLEKSGKFERPIATKILPESEFYRAEEYHQNYYKKKAVEYQTYKDGSGRKERLDELWGKK